MARILKSLGYIIYFAAGIIGLVWGLKIIAAMWGTFWTVVCLVLFPVPVYISPWILAIRDGDWRLVIIVYGATVAMVILSFIANLIDPD